MIFTVLLVITLVTFIIIQSVPALEAYGLGSVFQGEFQFNLEKFGI
jgi:ABC-type phosphate transport system permease subunit